ncbi:MAG: Kelch repeat-containing protein, partial [Terriglobia bacterium]
MTKRKNVMTPICVIGCFVLSLSARPVAAQSWKPLNPPAPRFYHSTAYDPTTNQMFVFGGLKGGPLNATGLLNDVWRLTSADGPGLSWFRLTPTGTPPARRSGAQTVYNPGSNKLVLFGGGLGFTSPCANDVWTLNNANGNGGIPSWAELTPSGTPPAPREDFAAVYDPTSDGMIVFGGDTCFTPRFNDVWVLYNADGVGGTPTWTQLSPTGVPPTPRDHCA